VAISLNSPLLTNTVDRSHLRFEFRGKLYIGTDERGEAENVSLHGPQSGNTDESFQQLLNLAVYFGSAVRNIHLSNQTLPTILPAFRKAILPVRRPMEGGCLHASVLPNQVKTPCLIDPFRCSAHLASSDHELPGSSRGFWCPRASYAACSLKAPR
jgi:hypothetical protein